ncbi:MAG: hemagglutinin [Pseudomonas sp.]|uniref:DUF637 domain-containing protein n=1 Tax=Pseudomonas sp. TaxID=306 RepID=UPI000CAF8500|nr:DUF637 domain-containing protein [Pseudomonas sp.]PJI46786.1 MAG: hemagglutinin [Pseudomonas sp.]
MQADRLVNRGGSLLSQQGLSLQGATLDNSQGGVLNSQRGLSVELSETLDNQAGGQLTSEDGLTVTAAQVDNRAGTVSSAQALNISANTLNNQGGKLLTDAALTVTAQTLDNRQGGVLSAKGALTLRGATLLNSQSGRILGGADLLLTQSLVNNSDKGRLEAAGRISGQLNSLDQHGGGQLVSNAGIDLDFSGGSLDNSQGGLLTTPGPLLLRNLAQLNNSAGGEVSSQNSFALNLATLNNQGGNLLSGGALTLSAQTLDNRQGGWVGATQGIDLRAGELLNQSGEISSHGAVSLDAGQLDNSAGRIASDDTLQVRSDNLTNQAGDLIGQGAVALRGGDLNNRQGRISSQGNVDLALTGTLDNRDRGQLISEGTLSIVAAEVDNRAGTLSSAQALNVNANTVNNQAGKLLTDATLHVTAATLDNRQGGVLIAKGVIDLRGATLLNAQAGRILSGADLLLTQTRVDNSEQGRLEAAGRVVGQVKVLDQHGGGQLYGQGGINLDFTGGNLDNRTGGLLATPGQLLLRNLAQVNNSGGEISSQQRFELNLGGLNNQGGRIVSADELSVQVLGGLIDNSLAGVLYGKNQVAVDSQDLNNSTGGTIASQGGAQVRTYGAFDNHDDGAVAAGLLHIQVGSLNNQSGSLSSAQDFYLLSGSANNQNGRIVAQRLLSTYTDDLDNRNGIISGQQHLTLGTQNIDNRAGLITTQGALDLFASRVDNRQGGELSAGGLLQLHVQQLIQQQGRLITGGDLSLDLAGGDLDNRDAVLSVGGLLRIDNLRHLDNRGGEIASENSFMLRAASIDNGDAGRIISAQQLTLDIVALRNANQGLLSGWLGLLVYADDLDNSAGGTLSSKLGFLDLTLSGVLDNHNQGALVSQGYQVLRVGSLNNQGGIISSQQDLLVIGNTVDNSADGLISAQQNLQINAGNLNNASGEIGAGQLQLNNGDLNNASGRIFSQSDLTLGVGILANAGGQIASGGDLLFYGGLIDNRGGQFVSQGLLSLFAGRFDNSQAGTLAAQGDLTLDLNGDLLNDEDGLIFSKAGQLNVSAANVSNVRGTLQAQNDSTFNVSGAINNQAGRLLSQSGMVDLNSASVDNVSGILVSLTGALKLVTGWFNNSTGITQGQSLDITATDRIDNRSGHLSAVSGDNRLSTTTLDNQGGGLYAGQTLALDGNNLYNQGGQIGAASIDFSLRNALINQGGLIESSGSLNLNAASIDNQNGRLRDLGQSGATTLTTSYLDNRNGRLETANTDLALNLGGLANAGGTFLHVGTGQFGVNAEQITQAGGSFITTGRLDISADSWSNSSVLQAGWLNLNIGQFSQTASGQLLASQALTGRGGNWNNDGLLASDGTLDIQLTGSYGGAGRVTSLGDLNLSANQLDISQGASVTGGQNATLGADSLYNYGRVTAAGNLTANTGALNNYGTLGSAGKLRINTWDLLNDGQQNGALLFSGDDMTLRVGGTLTNRFADLYSLGNLEIAANDAGGWTGRLENRSATIEAAGNLSIFSNQLLNTRDIFGLEQKLVTGFIAIDCGGGCDGINRGVRGNYPITYYVREVYEGGSEESSASAVIQAGRNLNIASQDLENTASVLAAGNDIGLSVATLTNQGGGSAGVRVRAFDAGELYVGDAWNLMAPVFGYNDINHSDPSFAYYWDGQQLSTAPVYRWDGGCEAYGCDVYAYLPVDPSIPMLEPLHDPNYTPTNLAPLPDEVTRHTLISDLWQPTGSNTGVSADAIIQAAGNIDIQASERIDNGVLHPGTAYTPGSARGSAATVEEHAPTIQVLNAQLPPDLSHQQVNPITLPGFSLPSGSNGLFRLSGQEGTQSGALTIEVGGGYSFAGQSINLSQRERSLDGASGRAGDLQWNATGVSGGSQRTGSTGETADIVQLNGASPSQDGANAPAWNVAQVQGVPSTARPVNSHKYLIETNPELTSLKSFLSSDYLLSLLGYDPDKSQKRLGDGLYEQRLIRDAVAARTGQRYLAGISDDENLFKYLMDNAIAYKDSLQLSLGVGLSAQQVAALTHDLVWLEEAEINGEKVLVPVLYLAQADNRLGPNGALIMGKDVTLISGGDLANQGTLRASDNLASISANLQNSGVIEGKRLDLLVSDSLYNRNGGVISGNNVNIAALQGDVLNQHRTSQITADSALNINAGRDFSNLGADVSSGGNLTIEAGRDVNNQREINYQQGRPSADFSWERTAIGREARIEAAGDAAISAGRDFYSSGSAVRSGEDLAIYAGRDVQITATEDRDAQQWENRDIRQSITQHGSEVTSGGDIDIRAGRDIKAIASQIDAERDIAISGGRDVTLASAADEEHSYSYSKSGNKKVTQQEDHVQQQASTVKAGGDVLIAASEDITLVSSKISAGNEAYLVAGNQIELQAANDSDHSLYDRKSKDKTRHNEVTDVKAVGSEISAGGDITMLSGGDQKYQAAKLDSGGDIAIVSGGAVTFEATKDMHQEDHQKSDSSFTRESAEGRGNTDETLRQSELLANGDILIHAVDGLKIDYKQLDQKSVSQAINAMVKADPNLAWLKDAEARGDVDWRAVKELHDSYSYSHSGMGQSLTLTVAIIATVATYGAASSAIGAGAASGSAFSAGAAGASAGWTNVAISTGMASMASTGAVSLGNNNGDLGTALSDTFSGDSLKQAAIAAGVAGFMAHFGPEWFGGQTDPSTNTTTSVGQGVGAIPDITNPAGWSNFAGMQLTQGVLTGAANEALGQGSFSDALQGSLYSLMQASAFKYVGDLHLPPGGLENAAAHALAGGMLSMAMGGDFKTGAVAAGASEALANILADGMLKGDSEQLKRMQQAAAQIVGIAAANAVDGDLQMGGDIAKSGMAYNRQLHAGAKKLAAALAEESDGRFTQEQIEAALRIASTDDGRTPATDMVVGLPGIYDPAGNWIPLGNSGLYVQTFEKADPEVIAYIKENAAGYNWTSEAETGFSKIFPNSGLGVGLDSEKRDWLTGKVIGEGDQYVAGSNVEGAIYYPKFSACGDAACLVYGAGLDVSAAGSQEYLRALLVKNLNDAATATTYGSLIFPAGLGGQVLTYGNTAASIGSGYFSGGLPSATSGVIEDFAINAGLSKAIGDSAGARVGAIISIFDLKGKINEYLRDDKK